MYDIGGMRLMGLLTSQVTTVSMGGRADPKVLMERHVRDFFSPQETPCLS